MYCTTSAKDKKAEVLKALFTRFYPMGKASPENETGKFGKALFTRFNLMGKASPFNVTQSETSETRTSPLCMFVCCRSKSVESEF